MGFSSASLRRAWLQLSVCLVISSLLILWIQPFNGLVSASDLSYPSNRPHGLIYPNDLSSDVDVGIIEIPSDGSTSSSAVDQFDIDRRLLNAAPILGSYQDSNGSLSDWMANIPDNQPITSLNIPGTHDSATWNYTQTTQETLLPITGILPPALAFQCQNRSLFQMLGDGIRFFDFRIGYLPDHLKIGFFHASALLSSTASLPDVLFGFYRWLDEHPTETILVSIKVDNATFGIPSSGEQPSTMQLQKTIYSLLTQGQDAQSHWLQEDSKLGNIGEARGKLIFLQRIEWDIIRSDPLSTPIGISLPPHKFNRNDKDFSIVYNNQTNSRAFIGDYYEILPNPTSVQDKIDQKVNAVEAHLNYAVSNDQYTSQQLFITFTSGGSLRNVPPVTPQMLALGIAGLKGVNQRLKAMIELKFYKKRLGIVIIDWYDQTPGLIETIIQREFTETPSSNDY